LTELNIKQSIGKRIYEARKAKGLTLKALGELTELKQTRLTNWEQGTRAPGPEEIKLLAVALEVSPAFLMCLSDDRQFKEEKIPYKLIPLLDHRQATEAKSFIKQTHEQKASLPSVAVSSELLPALNAEIFALKMMDDSMSPEIRIGDVLVMDLLLSPNPGDYVVVKLRGKSEVIICQYKKLSYTSPEFELLTLNDNWPNIKVNEGAEVEIIGTLVQVIRQYR
jgi:SOS-response transcriptional repressor LexA